MRKALIICILAISITLMVNVKAYAEDEPTATPTATPTSTPYQVLPVNNEHVDLNSVYYYYNEVLNSNQKMIVQYLTGSYNYMYLKARGFEYNDINDIDNLIDRIVDFGGRFWGQGLVNASRYNSTFQKYLAAIVNYAGTQNVDIVTWVENNTDFYIPYSVEGLEAWTTYYNDPSSESISSWGYTENPWVSGQYYTYAFNNYPFNNSSSQELYNNFILNNSPVLFTNVINNGKEQLCLSMKDIDPFNSLYVLRGNNYQFYRFGTVDGIFSTDIDLNGVDIRLWDTNQIFCGASNWYYKLNSQVYDTGSPMSISDIINYAFENTPIIRREGNNRIIYFNDCYPFISHVYLVDDLNTLENKVEISNSSDLNINDDNAKWIKTPKGQVLYWPTTGQLIDFEIPKLKKDDGNGNLVTIDPSEDLTQQVVNNTVINNYQIVAPGVVINVPVDWFESEGNYLDYTYNYSLPFFTFIGDVFLSLGEIRIFLLAGIILLICGGVIGKFLL